MEPSINGGANGFSQQSRNSISSYLDTRSCISIEQVGPTGSTPTGPAPTNPAPTPPAPAPPAPTSSNGDACGCSSCTLDVLARVANGFRCVDHINWIIRTQGRSQLDACAFVSDAFPSICGQGCDPNQCGNEDGDNDGDTIAARTIRSRQDSTCMAVNVANSNVRSSDCAGGLDQDWIYEADTQRIMTAFNSNFCLEWNLFNNDLMVSPCDSGNNQQWIWDGSSIKSQRNQNACIDLNTLNGNYYMNRCHGRADQQFLVSTEFF